MKTFPFIFLFISSLPAFCQLGHKVKSRVAHNYSYNEWNETYNYSSTSEETFYRADGQIELQISFISDSLVAADSSTSFYFQSDISHFRIKLFNYDEFNVLIETKHLDPVFHDSLLSRLTLKSKDDFLKQLKLNRSNSVEEKYREVYTFDNSHREIENRTYKNDTLISCNETEYNRIGKDSLNYTQEKTVYSCGENTIYFEAQSIYKNGLLVRENEQNLSLGVSYSSSYEYNKNKQMIKETSYVEAGIHKNLNLSKLPKSDALETNFIYDEQGLLTEKGVKNLRKTVYHYY